MADEQFEHSDDLNVPPSFFPYDRDDEDEVDEKTMDFRRCRVEAVMQAPSSEGVQNFVVISDGIRKMPIQIGSPEASAIILASEGHKPDRPMTHDLLKNVIERLNASVDRVLIDDLLGTTFYAKIVAIQGGTEILIDSRPSDAIAVCLRTGAELYVREWILNHESY